MTSSDSLKTLHTELIDARKGYEAAREEAEAPSMKDFFARMVRVHEGLHTDLHQILVARGEQPGDDGSFMATVHKTIISLRAAVTGLDSSALSGFADGEERILRAYEKAVSENIGDRGVVSTLERHQARIQALIGEMRALGS
jgi:uncharacterized protein (TIGR02284 family)